MGKTMDDPAVKDFQEKFPYYHLVATERNTVGFKHPDTEEVYTIEALTG